MGAWQAPSASAAEAQGGSAGGPHGWPHSVVRWLFGLGEEHQQPASTPIPVARFQNICISREAGSAAAHWRGWSVSGWAGRFMTKS